LKSLPTRRLFLFLLSSSNKHHLKLFCYSKSHLERFQTGDDFNQIHQHIFRSRGISQLSDEEWYFRLVKSIDVKQMPVGLDLMSAAREPCPVKLRLPDQWLTQPRVRCIFTGECYEQSAPSRSYFLHSRNWERYFKLGACTITTAPLLHFIIVRFPAGDKTTYWNNPSTNVTILFYSPESG
jgi:phage-related protein